MRVAALYDIHGNFPALEAVLDEVRNANVDLVVVGGDVLPGPMPVECVSQLLDCGIPTKFIKGNGESDTLAQQSGDAIGHLPEAVRDVVRWSGEQLGADHKSEIASWPMTLSVAIDGVGDVLFCHATLRNNTDIFTGSTPAAAVEPVFDGVRAPLVVCGHTHMQFDRRIGKLRIVNAGSVGMPFGDVGAYWLLLGPDVQLKRTLYDLDRAATIIRATSYLDAEQFATVNVLNPPSENEILQRLAAAELKVGV